MRIGGNMSRETFEAGERIKKGQEVWTLSGLKGVYGKPRTKIKGDEVIGTALETAEAGGLVVVELKEAK